MTKSREEGTVEQELALIEIHVETIMDEQRRIFESLLALKNMTKRLRRMLEKAKP